MDYNEENKEIKFLIIGAGPAGLIAGIHLAKLGIKAQIVDQHKQQIRPLCGEYLSPEGVNYIKRMELGDCLDGFNHLLGMTMFSAGGIKVCTSFPENSYGLSLNREIFQTRLSKKFESLGGIIHGVQLHVVHGLAYYKSLSEFFKKKSSPIFIMMLTTLIGFLSLITSDLEAIRQLAVTSSLSLLITWCLLLIIIHFFPIRFSINLPNCIKSKIKMKALPYKPFLGHGILTLFLIGGAVGLNKMPLLVEAAEFFSKDHQVQKGLTKISHDLGGTPQFELIITKNDKTEFDISDFKKIHNFENKLSERFPNTKFITLNNLVKFINEKYSGEKKLPDNIYAFNSLSSQIPTLLLNFQATEKAYRITYMGPIYTTEERDLLENKIKESFSQLDPTFKIKISGPTHLLLRSQKKLVSS